MTSRFPMVDWLAPVSTDPEVAEKQYALNWVLVGLVHTALLYGVLSLVAWAFGKAPIVGVLSGLAMLPFYFLAFWLGRRGRVELAAYIPTLALLLVMVVAQYQVGLGHGTMVGLTLATLTAGLLLGVWPAVLLAVLGTLAYVGLGVSQQAGYLVGALPPEQTLVADGISLGSGLLAVAIIVWLFHRQKNQTLALARESERRAQASAQELEQIQSRLGRQVEERTKDLEGFAEQLQKSLEEQQELWETVQRLSIPILPVHEGILVMPLIGHIDTARAERLVGDLLVAIEEQVARVVILDVTGVPVMDSQVASSVIQAARAARLLGAETVLVGVRPDVADTLAQLAVGGEAELAEVLGRIATQRDLQEGVRHALARLDQISSSAPTAENRARRQT